MNPWAENIKCILPILGYWSDMCSRKETCVRQNKCQIGGPLQTVLEIPYRFPKAILIVIDTQAQIYQYMDYIGRINTTRKKGFTNAQHKALLKHYGATKEEGQPGKARSINEKGLLYHVCDTKEPKPFDFGKSDDSAIRKAFENEEAFAIPIPCGGEVLPVLIVFYLKNDDQVMQLRNLIKERLLEIQVIVKDTRKESLGKLVSAIPSGDKPENDPRGKFSRWLLGWLEERDGLWLGNKLWFVVDHGLIHAKNLWKLANDLAREANLGENLSNLTVDKMSPLIFSLAIWLHDIGYKGIHIPDKMELMDKDLDKIIAAHGRISAALILNQKNSYNLNEFDESTLEHAGLVCVYHQSEYPIIAKENGNGSNSCSSIGFEEIIYGDKKLPLENLSSDNNVDALKVMASLLRLLDSCDYNRNRVGSSSMIELRKSVCKENASAQKEKFSKQLKNCLEIVKKKIKSADGNKKNDYGSAIKSLERMVSGKFIPNKMDDEKLSILRNLGGLLTAPKQKKKFENTLSLGKYIGYLNQQKDYYNVHDSVISVSFKKSENEKGSVDLVYEIDKHTLPMKNVRKEIKKFITKKTSPIYSKVLNKKLSNGIVPLKIKSVIPFTKNFDAWIDAWIKKQNCFKQPQKKQSTNTA